MSQYTKREEEGAEREKKGGGGVGKMSGERDAE